MTTPYERSFQIPNSAVDRFDRLKASHILANYGSFRAHAAHGDGLTYATFPLEMLDDYFRITVIDDKGRCADTNAYFTDDLLKL